MATVRKRGNSYQIRVSCGYRADGKQIMKSMTYKPLPNMTPRQIQKELDRRTVLFEERCRKGAAMGGNIKLADYAEIWFADYAEKQLKAKTVARYRDLLTRINDALGHLRIDRIEPRHLIEFYGALEKDCRKNTSYAPSPNFKQLLKSRHITQKNLADLAGVSLPTVQSCISGRNVSEQSAEKISAALQDFSLFTPIRAALSPQTVRYHHRLLSSMLSTAVEWQLIEFNPCTRVKPPRVPQKEAKYLDERQTAELVRCLDGEPLQYKTMVMLLLCTGMRRGELCGLNWRDVDIDRGIVSISRSSLYLSGRGVFEDTTKNKTSERVLRIPRGMSELLREHRTSHSRINGRVFTTADGSPIHPDTVTRWFSRFVTRHNFPGIHIHSLRHTNATLLIAAGTNLRTVSKRLGHAAVSTTANIYAHALKTADELAADMLADIFEP